MLYLGLACSCLWGCTFLYVVVLDRQIKDIRRRLNARMENKERS